MLSSTPIEKRRVDVHHYRLLELGQKKFHRTIVLIHFELGKYDNHQVVNDDSLIPVQLTNLEQLQVSKEILKIVAAFEAAYPNI